MIRSLRCADLAPVVLAGALVFVGAGASHARQIDTLALRAHTYFLADDLLAGRAAGSPGEQMAALYIESQLRRLGLRGAWPGGAYRQSVPLRAFRVADETRLMLERDGETLVFEHGREFVLATGAASAFGDAAGPAAFLPSLAPVTPDERHLAGRVLILPGTLGADAVEAVPRWKRAGVAAIVQLVPDSTRFALIAASRGTDRLALNADVDDPIWQSPIPTIVAGPTLARALLQDPRIPAAALRGQPGPPIQLGSDLRLSIRTEQRPLESTNVAAVLPGSDPSLRDEYVVYTAHLDHLGIEPNVPPGADSIYNGFSDNAAGVAMVLAIAAALRDEKPARSVLFLFLGAEERGLLGATFAATHPPVPLDRIAALINLDAGAPPAKPVSWRVAGGEGTALGALADSIARTRYWTATLGAASPNSDYWPFLRRGVPAIFLIPGAEWEGLDADQRDALRGRWDRYHQLDDQWAADFPFAGLARYAEFALAVGEAAAATPGAPPRADRQSATHPRSEAESGTANPRPKGTNSWLQNGRQPPAGPVTSPPVVVRWTSPRAAPFPAFPSAGPLEPRTPPAARPAPKS